MNGYEHALVTGVSGSTATVRLGKYSATLAPPDVAWTGKRASQLFKPGDLVYVKVLTLGPGRHRTVRLEQESGALGAVLARDNATRDVKDMMAERDNGDSESTDARTA